MTEAVYPYGTGADATTGYSGTDTSEARARGMRRSGKAQRVQDEVLREVAKKQASGLTIAELRETLPEHHHGTLSGALSNLHKAGRLMMLDYKRNKAHVYVTPMNVYGRNVRAFGRAAKTVVCPNCNHEFQG